MSQSRQQGFDDDFAYQQDNVGDRQPTRLLDDHDDTFVAENNFRRRRLEMNLRPTNILSALFGMFHSSTSNDDNSLNRLTREKLRYYSISCSISTICLLVLFSVLLPIIYFIAGTKSSLPTDNYTRAKVLATSQVPFIDGHVYLPSKLLEIDQKVFSNNNLIQLNQNLTLSQKKEIFNVLNTSLQIDFIRLQEGNISSMILINKVECKTILDTSIIVKNTLEMFDYMRTRIIEKYNLQLILTKNDLVTAFYKSKVSSMIMIEGSHTIGNSLQLLRQYYYLGARGMSLNTKDGCMNEVIINGKSLTKFGNSVIMEMNRLGLIIDLAFTSEKVIRDVLELSTAPIIISHTGVKSLCKHQYNIPDDVIQFINIKKGLIMIGLDPIMLKEEERKAYDNILLNNGTTLDMINWQLKNTEKRATIDTVVEHIEYIYDLTNSCENIALGSGFDGLSFYTKGLESTQYSIDIIAKLLSKKKFTDDCVRNIMGLNLLRVMEEVEQTAKKLST
ncbi:hypothetical protein ABK040_010964 [Willaertia magna]